MLKFEKECVDDVVVVEIRLLNCFLAFSFSGFMEDAMPVAFFHSPSRRRAF